MTTATTRPLDADCNKIDCRSHRSIFAPEVTCRFCRILVAFSFALLLAHFHSPSLRVPFGLHFARSLAHWAQVNAKRKQVCSMSAPEVASKMSRSHASGRATQTQRHSQDSHRASAIHHSAKLFGCVRFRFRFGFLVLVRARTRFLSSQWLRSATQSHVLRL